jgi:uncharacterized protein (DUF58 family)
MSSDPDSQLVGSHPYGIRRLRANVRKRFREFSARRNPPSRSITLDQKRVFIFPSRVGFFFLACMLLMLMTAVNYENNMGFALTFLLVTLFVIAILHTFANLSGLTIQARRAQSTFPGHQAEFVLLISRAKRREHYGLRLQWPRSTESVVNLENEDRVEVHLHAPVGERGWYSPGRLLLESTYPLGLLRCWTSIDLDLHALVYPRALACPELAGLENDQPDGAAVPVVGSDDFYGFRDYRRGDSPRQIHWKGLAKGQSVQSKQYGAYADRSVWLDWEAFPGAGVEQRLSHICYWALEFDKRNEEYGLRIPGTVIEPGVGEKHLEEILKVLALYGADDKHRET